MSIGERIIELRKEQNISQGQLAQAMEVSRQAVSKWENDLASPDTLKLIKLAEYLDTDIEYLATGRKTFGRRPPVVVETVKTVEKIVEKPVEKVIEKQIEIEKPVIQFVEKPVIKKVVRVKYQNNIRAVIFCSVVGFLLGLVAGLLL